MTSDEDWSEDWDEGDCLECDGFGCEECDPFEERRDRYHDDEDESEEALQRSLALLETRVQRILRRGGLVVGDTKEAARVRALLLLQREDELAKRTPGWVLLGEDERDDPDIPF